MLYSQLNKENTIESTGLGEVMDYFRLLLFFFVLSLIFIHFFTMCCTKYIRFNRLKVFYNKISKVFVKKILNYEYLLKKKRIHLMKFQDLVKKLSGLEKNYE